VQGCGRCNDYCRWVGGVGTGGDPQQSLEKQHAQHPNRWSWWSCRLAGASSSHSPRGHFASWDHPKCSGEGASPPPPPPPPGTCLPAQTEHRGAGYTDEFRGWYDVQGCGRCNDYCRWVGGVGTGGDPQQSLEKQHAQHPNRWSWWSCRLAGASSAWSPRGHFASWDNISKCFAEGASPPPPATPYVPGQPGAPWTAAEMLAVRAKLHRVFTEGLAIYHELGLPRVGEYHTAVPNGAKALRLGFHDCLKYADGSGGCDGCLEWTGVGVRIPRANLSRGLIDHNADDGHNNGLGPMAEALEAVYTRADFPRRTPRMELSLQQSGKSRADLWAFAATVAVEQGIELNNAACESPAALHVWPYHQCHPREGMSDCKVSPPRSLSFKTGRRDCIATGSFDQGNPHSFKTAKTELHPNPSTNGHGTVRWFKENFGFSGRETVAIMGAHNLGRFHVIHSLFRYTWKTMSAKLFNNGYHRNLAKRQDWYFPSDGQRHCAKVGNASGGRPVARWMPHVRADTTSGGPVQWLQEKLVCKSWDPTSATPPTCAEADLQWKFVVGVDETAMPCEIGLYTDFQVDQNGIPHGCRGFEDFNMRMWRGFRNRGRPGLKGWRYTWTMINGQRAEPECPHTMIREPADAEPTSQIVEEYADDSTAFLRDFIPTLEKMLANGYAEGELQDAPAAGMSGFSCPIWDPTDRSADYTCTADVHLH